MEEKMQTRAEKGAVQPRYRSWAVWTSVLGALGLILQATGVLDLIGMTDESWNAMVTAIGTLLTVFGIVNNPTDRAKF